MIWRKLQNWPCQASRYETCNLNLNSYVYISTWLLMCVRVFFNNMLMLSRVESVFVELWNVFGSNRAQFGYLC